MGVIAILSYQIESLAPWSLDVELAFQRFEMAMSLAELYLSSRRFPENFRKFPFDDFLAAHSPWVLSNNLLLPYLVSVLEDYFKSTFVALLKYSDRKEKILKSARLEADQLLRLSEGDYIR